jgi:selenocysteine lyase/cysteine desulfurase
MAMIQDYERSLVAHLIKGLQQIKGLRIYGITDPIHFDQRVPTVAFRIEGFPPRRIAEALGERGIFVWDGNYYALAVTERLDVEDKGGMVRVGLAHYNTREEVDRLLKELHQITKS